MPEDVFSSSINAMAIVGLDSADWMHARSQVFKAKYNSVQVVAVKCLREGAIYPEWLAQAMYIYTRSWKKSEYCLMWAMQAVLQLLYALAATLLAEQTPV